MDVAVFAGDVAQRAGIEPERFGMTKRNRRPLMAHGGDRRMLEFSEPRRFKRLKFHAIPFRIDMGGI